MKIGALCSAGGSAFFASADIAIATGLIEKEDLVVVTDRACSAETEAEKRNIGVQRIENNNRTAFSTTAFDCFQQSGATLVLLYFTRLVSSDLFSKIATLNIHPSLLPAFPGFGAIASAHKRNLPIGGATLHVVTDGIDNGPIIAQTASPIINMSTVDEIYAVSFLHKCYLSLVAFDLINQKQLQVDPAASRFTLRPGLRTTASAAPALQSEGLIAEFKKFLQSRPVHELTFIP